MGCNDKLMTFFTQEVNGHLHSDDIMSWKNYFFWLLFNNVTQEQKGSWTFFHKGDT